MMIAFPLRGMRKNGGYYCPMMKISVQMQLEKFPICDGFYDSIRINTQYIYIYIFFQLMT